MRILGAVIAGGKSIRMGQEKALVKLGSKSIILRVVDRLLPQVEDAIVNANGDTKRFEFLELDIVPDIDTELETPLAGIHAALIYAKEEDYNAVVTVPSDAPFVPHDLVRKLSGTKPAIANSKGQQHYLTGFWPVSLLPLLEAQMVKSNRVQDWVKACGAASVNWRADDYDPFLNINTPADLKTAHKILPRMR
ncbi:MAG: molybdenum cofactor guanylyltransferase [Alphaproteobacteria bacterium]|nr:molybdenum cofactor guanylyltransferase [Alphaproteobacteria bacterium]